MAENVEALGTLANDDFQQALGLTFAQIKQADAILRRALPADPRVNDGPLLAGVVQALAANFATITKARQGGEAL
jgi:hypothetical protein